MWWGIASHNKRQNRGCQRCDENTHNTTNKRKTIRRKVGGQGAKAAIALRKHVLMSRDATQPFAHSRCRPLFSSQCKEPSLFIPCRHPLHHTTAHQRPTRPYVHYSAPTSFQQSGSVQPSVISTEMIEVVGKKNKKM